MSCKLDSHESYACDLRNYAIFLTTSEGTDIYREEASPVRKELSEEDILPWHFS